jgi:hypothetical protein
MLHSEYEAECHPVHRDVRRGVRKACENVSSSFYCDMIRIWKGNP